MTRLQKAIKTFRDVRRRHYALLTEFTMHVDASKSDGTGIDEHAMAVYRLADAITQHGQIVNAARVELEAAVMEEA